MPGAYYNTSTSDTIWVDWVTTGTTCSTANYIWDNWCDTGTTNTTVSTHIIDARGYRLPHGVTAEELNTARERAKAEVAAQEARWEALRAKQAAAEKRAEELLLENVTLKERNDFLKKGYFVVQGRVDRYRIRRGTHGNIDVVGRDGRIKHRLCAQPNGIPVCDAVLAQKLTLEHDEEHFLKKANVHHHGHANEVVLPALLN